MHFQTRTLRGRKWLTHTQRSSHICTLFDLTHHNTMFGSKRLKHSGDMDWNKQLFFEDFRPQHDFDLRTTIQNCHTTRDDALLYQIWLQKVNKFRRYGTGSKLILRIWPHTVTLNILYRNQTFLHDTLGHDDAPPSQVSWRKVKWFRRYEGG